MCSIVKLTEGVLSQNLCVESDLVVFNQLVLITVAPNVMASLKPR